MTAASRERAAWVLDRGRLRLERVTSAYSGQLRETMGLYRRALTAPDGRRPTPRQYARTASNWLVLPLAQWTKSPLDAQGHERAAEPPLAAVASAPGAFSGPKEWLIDVWAASIDWWAAVLGCSHEEGLAADFDAAAEMVGPMACPLPPGAQSVMGVTDLTHELGRTGITKDHIVARVLKGGLSVSIVDLGGLQQSLSIGAYRGAVTTGSGLVIPIVARRR